MTIFYVSAEGAVEEIFPGADGDVDDTRLAAWCDLACALLSSDADDLAFHEAIGRSLWYHVNLRAERARLRPRVLVEAVGVPAPYGLTHRELEVVTLIAAGVANEGISIRLEISRRTVEKHIENIFYKTDTWSRAGLAGLAVDRGLLVHSVMSGDGILPLRLGQVTHAATTGISARPHVRRLERCPVTIGMPLPQQDVGHDDALEMLNGARLAVDRLNARGGILDREVRLEMIDCDITDPQVMRDAIRTLIDKEVDAITAGYFCADQSIFEMVGDYNAPFLHAATLDHVVNWVREDVGQFGNIFQTNASDINYGRGMARFLSGLVETSQWVPDSRRIAVIQPPWPGLNLGLSDLDLEIVGRNWEIKVIAPAASGSRRWSEVMQKLEGFDPSVILLASFLVEDSIDFQRDFTAAPLRALVYKIYSPSVPVYRESLASQAEGVLWATTTGLYNDRIGRDFRSTYMKTYGCRPGRSHAGIAFDRINLFAGAWTRVGSTRRFDDIAADLRATVYRGVNGAYHFDRAGQVGLAFPDDTQDPSISQAHLVFQIQEGRQKIISPAPYADGTFRLPPWFAAATR